MNNVVPGFFSDINFVVNKDNLFYFPNPNKSVKIHITNNSKKLVTFDRETALFIDNKMKFPEIDENGIM